MTQLTDGPWEQAFYVELPTKLRSKSNYRRGKKGWDALSMFETVAAGTFTQHAPEGWDLGDKDKPVKDRPTVVAAIVATTMLDSGNLSKSVFDAMEGVLVHNDASIQANAAISQRSRDGERCGVAVAQLPPNSSLEMQSAALSALLAKLPALYTAD